MATQEASRRAPCAGEAEAVRTDVALCPITDAEPPPGPPPVDPIVVCPEPPPPEGRGLAVPLLYASLALAHVGGDERDRAIGVLYALAALQHILAER